MVNPRVVVSLTSYVRLEKLKLCKADTFPDVIERLLDEHDAKNIMDVKVVKDINSIEESNMEAGEIMKGNVPEETRSNPWVDRYVQNINQRCP